MKKALTLALAVTMLISTLMFTSCDVSSIMDMLGGDFGSETTPAETTPEETTPPAPKRHTITEAEWEAILNSTNYTFKTSSGGSYSVEYFGGDNAVCMTSKQGDISNTVYWENKNGKIYQIMDLHQNGQWVAFEDEYSSWNNVPSWGKQTGLADSEFFEILQYNEATKSYIAEEDGGKAEFFFEDGKLIKGTVTDNANSDFIWMVENVGTTVVTLPEYIVSDVNPNEPPAVETTYSTPNVAKPQIPDSNE